jgi:hypothetical protein
MLPALKTRACTTAPPDLHQRHHRPPLPLHDHAPVCIPMRGAGREGGRRSLRFGLHRSARFARGCALPSFGLRSAAVTSGGRGAAAPAPRCPCAGHRSLAPPLRRLRLSARTVSRPLFADAHARRPRCGRRALLARCSAWPLAGLDGREPSASRARVRSPSRHACCADLPSLRSAAAPDPARDGDGAGSPSPRCRLGLGSLLPLAAAVRLRARVPAPGRARCARCRPSLGLGSRRSVVPSLRSAYWSHQAEQARLRPNATGGSAGVLAAAGFLILACGAR